MRIEEVRRRVLRITRSNDVNKSMDKAEAAEIVVVVLAAVSLV
jgi:hypothetical protein